MKIRTWASVVAALLLIGVLAGVVAFLGKTPDSGGNKETGGASSDVTQKPDETTKPGETTETVKRKTVVTNQTAKYGYRLASDAVGYLVYSDELKKNTDYQIQFNFAEDDFKTFLELYELSFSYRVSLHIPEAGESFDYRLIPSDGEGMKPGYYHDFRTDDNGTFVLMLLIGPTLYGTEAEKTEKITKIVHYIRDNMPFQIVEIVR